MAECTPMMKQYFEIKEQTKDCILFFRLGDFYEMFDDDARIASKELDLALTTRDRSKENPDDRTPMCGIPYHSSEAYIARLLAKGYKVAICEQTEDPALAKGLVSRDIVRVITPGTVIDSSMLEENRSNYICSVYSDAAACAVCFCDMSTGEVCATSFAAGDRSKLFNELARFCPKEAVLSAGASGDSELCDFLIARLNVMLENRIESFEYMPCAIGVCSQFDVSSVDELGLGDNEAAVCAVGALLTYLRDTQKTDLHHINTLNLYSDGQYMELDLMTRRNLELTETLRTGEKRGSLLWVLDKTKTSMGSRMLRSWVERPLLNPIQIKHRLSAVGTLKNESVARGELSFLLRDVGDIQRLVGRAVYGTANCRDLLALAKSCSQLPRIKELLEPLASSALENLAKMDPLEDVSQRIFQTICDEPPFSVREGGMIRDGFDPEVDRLRSLMKDSRGAVAAIENAERERTGVKKLKIGYNKVFGYYIEIPRALSESVPENYIRKQTLANSERFITQELKELELTLLNAKDRITALEYELYTKLREYVAENVERIQNSAAAAAETDVYCSLAQVASDMNYCMPEIDCSGVIDIKDGRHPVVEKMLKNSLFVANDTYLDTDSSRTAIITGPNMAGKSTYMRQTALIVLMAQIGSFVPARDAHIGIVDRVFTRIGASDDLASGQSTFMVEMNEVAGILKHATKNSLLILDEIGRGTSTYDGMSIARAVLEFCTDKRRLGAKTMFATHYHELTAIEDEMDGVKNYNIAAKKRGNDIIFLRKIVPGGADDSYGIEVARLAGVPEPVLKRAKDILGNIEAEERAPLQSRRKAEDADGQLSLGDMGSGEVAQRLKNTELNTLTPIEAMNLLFELKKLV